jgi:lipopolysaccharide heptosyltransferase II
MAKSNSWQAARKILCIRLDNIGDVLMTTPAFRAIKDTCSDCTVTLLASPAGERVAGLSPDIDNAIVFDAPWMKATQPPAGSGLDLRMIERLRHENFDAAIIFTVFTQNPLPAAYLAYLAGIPLRLAHCRENPYHLLTDWARETDLDASVGIRHEVRRQLDLVGSVGFIAQDERMHLDLPPGLQMDVRNRLAQMGVDFSRPWVLIHPGATAPSRRYPPEAFAQAAGILAGRFGLQIVLTGGPGERELAGELESRIHTPAINTVGQFNFDEFVAQVSLASVLVCNNSGPAHIAAAVGVPVVDVYALTNPQHTPWLVPSRVLSYDVPCKNCFRSVCPQAHNDCIRRVTPEDVAQATFDLMAETEQIHFERRLAA